MSGGETKQRISELEAEIARLRQAQPTLRDQFAMAALQMDIWCDIEMRGIAKKAYGMADAMMEERNDKD